MENTKAAILCGGTGSRLRPLTYYFQKTMLPIGNSQKPILEYVIGYIKHFGINSFTLLVGYKAEQIVNYFKDGIQFNAQIDYSYDREDIKGNGGALINAYLAGKFDGYSNVLIYYSDILATLDISKMHELHITNDFDATIAVSDHYKLPVGVASVENNKVTKFEEKPNYNINSTIGILILKVSAIKKFVNMAGDVDIMKDMIQNLVAEGKVGAYVTNDFWIDVGSTDTYEKLDHNAIDSLFSKYLI
ncbi:MAG: nucleotidyltransferase family protein [Nitrososphaerota archaeon]|jgi:mannose-1-phosphate guanylyltransferase|nr:nucleotidyltransferase family protein [Nitrososphaerota archaeon]MDG6927470.1 nucleotidyltransferase family protein [Nitrososphaerota archaeon]MDG6930688.1 nucleotidyltransferase family protein [Nitrososphaerota archaeon]MDG6931533.1 nucleotidyltransferase family protein [Nitrososphaerota archaeon]MDG6936266.1 nucleotidyltransferase family protein [Nitrososphaerota archaeon]